MPDFSIEVVFVALSLIIAIFVMIESTLLERNGGKLLLNNGAFMLISLSTSAWMVAAFLAWYFLDLRGLSLVVAMVYPLYGLLGLVYSAMLMRGIEVDDPAEVALPKKYLSFCKSFGLVYSVLCLAALLESIGLIQL